MAKIRGQQNKDTRCVVNLHVLLCPWSRHLTGLPLPLSG